jgi:hypothetical protein
VSYDDLVAEFEGPERIGPAIWGLLVEVTGRVCRRYPPRVYADDSQWNRASIEDLAQTVALERLLGESQLDYIFMRSSADPARGLATVEGLLAVQIQRTLAHRRAPSVVDRLVRRIKLLLQDPSEGVRSREIGADTWIWGLSEPAPATLSPSDRSRGVHRIADIPKIPSNPLGERESKVYGAPQLADVVRRLCDEYGGLYLSDLRRILEELLTAWLPEILYDTEDDSFAVDSLPSEVEVTEMTTELRGLLDVLSNSQLAVMIGKSNGVSDTQLAAELGCSRPTVIKYRREYAEVVGRFLIDEIPDHRHALAMELLLELAMEREGGQSDGGA